MSQHDYDIANADGATVRADLNALFEAIATRNAGTSAPTTTFPHMLWVDETNDLIKIRNEANTAWVDFYNWDGSAAPTPASGGGGSSPITTRGDIIRGDSGGAEERLALGTNGQVLKSDGTDVVWAAESGGGGGGEPQLNNVLAPHEGLVNVVNASNPTFQVDVDATNILLKTTGGDVYTANAVNLTADITASGADGLDTGSEANSTWYFIWVIYNSTTVASLLSTSSTAPTMPSGYTYKGLVGAVYNDSGGDFDWFHQEGNFVTLNETSAASGLTATTLTSIDISAFVPPIAKKIGGYGKITGTGNTIRIISTTGGTSRGITRVTYTGISSNSLYSAFYLNIVVAQTIYYFVSSSGNGQIVLSSYEYN